MDTETKDSSLPVQLMAKPAISFEELFIDILELPKSTAEAVVREEPKPKFFLIGRRRYIRTPDAITWLDLVAEANPYFPRLNKRASAP
jgi:hypothetical protein